MRFRHRLVPAIAIGILGLGPTTVTIATVGRELVGPVAATATATEQAERLGLQTPTGPSGPTPPGAEPVDTSNPDHVVGSGTPQSCTSEAVVAAVAAGGVITFDCGPDPVTIEMDRTAKVVNTSPIVVIDGGGSVTLSGRGERRILYMNTCDPDQIWTTSHCQNQDHPRLTLQNIGFTRGNSTGEATQDGGGGGGSGGAVYVRGGQVRVLDATFTANRCDATGPDVGGASLRVLSQFENRPVIVSNSTFGGSRSQDANICSNGGGISSIGVSWKIHGSTFRNNRAVGNGANPARPGTPGGGNGGAIYLDGNRFTLDLVDTVIEDNTANEGGSAIFFVSNDRTGELAITNSTLRRNTGDRFGTAGFPGVFFLGSGPIGVVDSTIE